MDTYLNDRSVELPCKYWLTHKILGALDTVRPLGRSAKWEPISATSSLTLDAYRLHHFVTKVKNMIELIVTISLHLITYKTRRTQSFLFYSLLCALRVSAVRLFFCKHSVFLSAS